MPVAREGDEGRGKLRKAPGRRKRPLIRRFPNGATRQSDGLSSIFMMEANQEEEKTKCDSPSSGERPGKSPNRRDSGSGGVVGPRRCKIQARGSVWKVTP